MISENTRKLICIPAYIIVGLCAMICALGALLNNPNISMHALYKNSELMKNIVNIILLGAGIITLSCAVGWLVK
jgi:hypothetical protein